MNFTLKSSVVSTILATTVAIGLASPVASAPPQILAPQGAFTAQPPANDAAPIVTAVELTGSGSRTVRPDYFQPTSSWYKNKHWWKKNAPIIGGTAGGALIGGLAGGGKGALIGGVAGGGGGYLYKRLKHRHYRHQTEGSFNSAPSPGRRKSQN